MNQERVKLIVRNLESLIECLKQELEEPKEVSRMPYEEIAPYLEDYDEIYDESEDY